MERGNIPFKCERPNDLSASVGAKVTPFVDNNNKAENVESSISDVLVRPLYHVEPLTENIQSMIILNTEQMKMLKRICFH